MIGVSEFVDRVETIAERRLTYRIGGVGKDGTCDCIGLIMGAMIELGHAKYDLHSTNYFARFQTMELKRASERELFIGQILYRARESIQALNERYKSGGRYYTGDMLDYYHVGVVTGIKPLRIIECTQYDGVNGIRVSTALRNWQYAGRLRGVSYEKETAKGELQMLYRARVITQEDPLSLRDAPGGRKTGELPKGSVVDVFAEGEWMLVEYGGERGYASAKYLERIAAEEGTVTVRTILTDEAGNMWEPVGGYSAKMMIVSTAQSID